MGKKIFVNLPAAKEFFGKLGFSFNPKFSDEKGACMVIGDNIFAMLLSEPFFQSFTKKPVSDAKKSTEVLVAVSLDSRQAVDEMVEKAVAAGGREARDKQDYGWMYGRAIEDLDGHIWEVFFMDEKQRPQQ